MLRQIVAVMVMVIFQCNMNSIAYSEPVVKAKPLEAWIVKKLIAGEVADLSEFKPDEGVAGKITSQKRILTSKFVIKIIRESQDDRYLRGVRIKNAVFEEMLDLSYMNIPCVLWIENSDFNEGIKLRYATCSRYLSLEGAHIKKTANFEHFQSKGILVLSKSRIETKLNISYSFLGSLTLSKMDCEHEVNILKGNIKGDIHLSHGKCSEVNMMLTKVQGSILAVNQVLKGELVLNQANVDGGLSILESKIGNGLNLQDSTIHSDVAISDSTFSMGINANSLYVGKNFILDGETHIEGDLNLSYSNIGGDITFKMFKGNISKELYLDFAEVNNDVMLWSLADKKPIVSSVNCFGTKIGRNLYVRDLLIEKRLSLFMVSVGGNFDVADLSLDGLLSCRKIVVGNTLSFVNVSCKSAVDVETAKVKENAIFRKCAFQDKWNAKNMMVEGSLLIQDCSLQALDLSNSEVKETLSLWKEGCQANKWTNNDKSLLCLRNASVDSLQDHPEGWPLKLDLLNFAYNKLGGYSAQGKHDMSNRDAAWLIQWLERSGNGRYQEQIYKYLAQVLKDMGRSDDSDAVLYAAYERDRNQENSYLKWIWLTLLSLVAGYGLELWRAVMVAVLMIGLGAAILRYSKEGRSHGFKYGLSYSFDKFVPFVTLEKRHEDVRLGNGYRHWFYIHQLSGYVLASVVAAGILRAFGG